MEMNRINYTRDILTKIIENDRKSELIMDIGVSQEQYEKRIKYYRSIPQPKQKSLEWLKQRTDFITASSFKHALAKKWNKARTDLLKEKVSKGNFKSFFGNEYTRWGEKYEPVSNAIYCYKNKVQVEDFGLIPHIDKKLYFMAASTDGINNSLINLEIKSPMTRIIKPGMIKSEYWIQMQLQMAVLDLPLSHFLECRFREYKDEVGFWDDFDFELEKAEHLEKGIIIEYMDMTLDDGAGKMVYAYSPVEFCTDRLKLQLWEKMEIKRMLTSTHLIYIRNHYWVLNNYSCVNVARNHKWFSDQLPTAIAFWEEVEYYREHGGVEALEADYQTYLKKLDPKTRAELSDEENGKNWEAEYIKPDDPTFKITLEDELQALQGTSENNNNDNNDNDNTE